jgi:hypothetical protein
LDGGALLKCADAVGDRTTTRAVAAEAARQYGGGRNDGRSERGKRHEGESRFEWHGLSLASESDRFIDRTKVARLQMSALSPREQERACLYLE